MWIIFLFNLFKNKGQNEKIWQNKCNNIKSKGLYFPSFHGSSLDKTLYHVYFQVVTRFTWILRSIVKSGTYPWKKLYKIMRKNPCCFSRKWFTGNDRSAGKILLQESRLLIMEIGSVSTFVASLVERALSKGNWKKQRRSWRLDILHNSGNCKRRPEDRLTKSNLWFCPIFRALSFDVRRSTTPLLSSPSPFENLRESFSSPLMVASA